MKASTNPVRLFKAISMFSPYTFQLPLEQLCPSHDSCLNFFERVTLMHELYRAVGQFLLTHSASISEHIFIIPCNPHVLQAFEIVATTGVERRSFEPF